MIHAITRHTEVVCTDIVIVIALRVGLATGVHRETRARGACVDGATVIVFAVGIGFTTAVRSSRREDANSLFATVCSAQVVPVITLQRHSRTHAFFAEVILGTGVTVRASVIVEFLNASKNRVAKVGGADIAVFTFSGREAAPFLQRVGTGSVRANVGRAEVVVIAFRIRRTASRKGLLHADTGIAIRLTGVHRALVAVVTHRQISSRGALRRGAGDVEPKVIDVDTFSIVRGAVNGIEEEFQPDICSRIFRK